MKNARPRNVISTSPVILEFRSILCPVALATPCSVGFIRLQTVADMPDLYFFRRIGDSAGGIFKERLLLGGFHQAEKLARLGIVIVIILTEIPVVGGAFQFERRFGKIRLFLPLAVAVGFIAQCAALIAVNPHEAVPVEAVNGACGER